MQPIFTVQYAEFRAAEYLKKRIKKVSAYIPISPQEKGVDFLICKYEEENSKNITLAASHTGDSCTTYMMFVYQGIC